MDAWDHHPWDVRVPGGETYAQVEKRLRETLLRIAEKHEGGTVAAGTHGVATRSVLCMALYGTLSYLDKIPWCDNTAVNLVTVENGKIAVDYLNDNSISIKAAAPLKRRNGGGTATNRRFSHVV
jgi:probable phosphoglycerate mutase